MVLNNNNKLFIILILIKVCIQSKIVSEETVPIAGGVQLVQHTCTNIDTGAPCPPTQQLPQLTPYAHPTIPLPTQHTAVNACTHPTTPLSTLLSMPAHTLPPHSAHCYRCLHTPHHPTQHTAIDDCTHPTTPLSILLSMTAHTLLPHSAYCYR